MTMFDPPLDPDHLIDVGMTIFGAACSLIDAAEIGDFPRRRFYPGSEIAWDVAGMLACRFNTAYIGQPGHQQFSPPNWFDPAYAFQTAQFFIELVVDSPIGDGSSFAGITPPTAEALNDTTFSLLRSAWVVFAGLARLAVNDQLFPGLARNTLVTPITAVGPRGGLVAMTMGVATTLV